MFKINLICRRREPTMGRRWATGSVLSGAAPPGTAWCSMATKLNTNYRKSSFLGIWDSRNSMKLLRHVKKGGGGSYWWRQELWCVCRVSAVFRRQKPVASYLREYYLGKGKPRIIALYTELTSLSMASDERVTDYVIRDSKRPAEQIQDIRRNRDTERSSTDVHRV